MVLLDGLLPVESLIYLLYRGVVKLVVIRGAEYDVLRCVAHARVVVLGGRELNPADGHLLLWLLLYHNLRLRLHLLILLVSVILILRVIILLWERPVVVVLWQIELAP
jgi:hypothetical protein